MKKIILAILIVLFSFQFAIAGPQGRSGVTAQTIINNARSLFLNEDTAVMWTDAVLLRALNYGIIQIPALTKCTEATTQITLTAGVSEYGLSGVSYISVEKVMYSGVTTDYTDDKPSERKDISNLSDGEDIEQPVRYATWNDNVYLDPVPRTTDENIVVFYVSLPSGVTLTQEIPLPAIYDYALTVFVASKAFKRDGKMNRSKALEDEYLLELSRYSADLVERLRTNEK